MPSRSAIWCAMLIAATLSLVGCTQAPVLTSIQVIPSSASLTTVGETVQFKAIGSYNRSGDHPTTTVDITSKVFWASTDVSVSTISASGLATAGTSGTTSITASMGGAVGTSSLTVSAAAVRGLTSISIIPASQTLSSFGESSQFIAIGTYTSNPITADLTNDVTWQSSDVKVATINSAGLALANASGTTTITAIGTGSGGGAITATSTLTVSGAGGGVVLPALTVYDVGLGTGTVKSADGVINCPSTGGAACTGNYSVGTIVTLTATPSGSSSFGGWSSNCQPTAPGSATCTVTMNNNEPVGAIFN